MPERAFGGSPLVMNYVFIIPRKMIFEWKNSIFLDDILLFI